MAAITVNSTLLPLLALLMSTLLIKANLQPPSPMTTPTCPPASLHSTPSKLPNTNRKCPMTTTGDSTRLAGPATHRGDHLKTIRQVLEHWRFKMHYSHGPTLFTAARFLPDKALTT